MMFTPRSEEEIHTRWMEIGEKLKYIGMMAKLRRFDLKEIPEYLILEAQHQSLLWLYQHTERHPEWDQHYKNETELRAQLPMLDADIIRYSDGDPLRSVNPTLMMSRTPEQHKSVKTLVPAIQVTQALGFMAMRNVILWTLGERPEI